MQMISKMPHWLLVLYSFADFSFAVLTVVIILGVSDSLVKQRSSEEVC